VGNVWRLPTDKHCYLSALQAAGLKAIDDLNKLLDEFNALIEAKDKQAVGGSDGWLEQLLKSCA
jgi:hypothetical protein